jgi:hypothetical protein
MHTVEHNRLAAGSIVENRLQQNRGGEKIALPFARLDVEIQIGLDGPLIAARPSPSSLPLCAIRPALSPAPHDQAVFPIPPVAILLVIGIKASTSV